jgi:hypothetical protein
LWNIPCIYVLSKFKDSTTLICDKLC